MPGQADELDDDILDLENDVPSGDDPPGELPAEQEARLRGWKPLEEYKGPPGRWRSAEEYLRIGNSDNAVLREENRRLTTRVHRMEGQLTTVQSTMEELRDIARRADKQGYDRALAELKARRHDAVAEGNTDAFEAVERQIEALTAERTPPAPAPKPETAIPPPIQDFIEANPWYRTDDVLQKTMMRLYDIVHSKNPDWQMEDILTEAKRRTIEEFPEKFNMPNDPPPAPRERPRANQVLRPGGAPPAPRRGSSGWDLITDEADRREARAAYQNGLRHDPDQPESEFIELYINPRADAIELRRQRPARK